MRRDDERRTRGPHAPRQLGSANVLRLQALGPARDFELHLLAFLQGLETFHLNRRMMAEDILAAVILGDETKTLRIIEPFYCTACHENYAPYWGGGCRAVAMKPLGMANNLKRLQLQEANCRPDQPVRQGRILRRPAGQFASGSHASCRPSNCRAFSQYTVKRSFQSV